MNKLDTYHVTDQARMIEGLKARAKDDASDPFTFARGMTHLRNGVAGFRMDDGVRTDAFYKRDALP